MSVGSWTLGENAELTDWVITGKKCPSLQGRDQRQMRHWIVRKLTGMAAPPARESIMRRGGRHNHWPEGNREVAELDEGVMEVAELTIAV